MVLVLSFDGARAQETELPGITVESAQGGGQKQKKKPAAAPAPVAAAPAPAEAASVSPPTEAVYETPAAVSVVGSGDIATFGKTGLDSVLRSVPGTFTRESAANPGVAVNIRGFEGQGRVNMTIDGARQNFRFTAHEAGGFTYVDPALLAGIDIERGAVSTAGGAGALAGTANFRTLDIDDILKPGHDIGAITSVTWGSNNLGFSEMAAGAARSGAFGVAGAISRTEPDNFKNGDGQTVPFTHEDLWSGLFKVELRPSSEESLKVGGVFYNNDFAANSYDQTVESNTWTAKYSYNPRGNDLIDFKLNGYHTDIHVVYGNEWTTNAPGSATGRNFDDQGWGFDVSNGSQFTMGPMLVSTVYGYEYFRDEVETFNTRTPAAAGGVNPSGTSSIGGFFSQTKFTLGMFDLIGGLRWDEYKLDGSFDNPANNPLGLPAGITVLDKQESRWSPKVTLAATVTDWLQPYVTYSESMRAPTINETMFGGSHPGGTSNFGGVFFPNPFLDPEIQRGWEFGANIKKDNVLSRGDRFRFKADYFRMNVEDYIVGVVAGFVPSPIPGPPVLPATLFVNAPGTSLVEGVEMQGSYDAGEYFGSVSYTWTESNLPTQINGQTAFTYMPDYVLTLTGGLRFLSQRLTVGARGTFVGEGFSGTSILDPIVPSICVFGGLPAEDCTNGPNSDPYALLDLFSSYEFDTGLVLGLTVTNVFDLAYTPATETPIVAPPGAPPIFDGELGRGRTFLLSARAQF